jgi:hypothetical protein
VSPGSLTTARPGSAQGTDAVRSIILAVKSLYEYQDINLTRDYGDTYFIEDYTGMATSTEAVPARPDAGPRTLSAAISR